MKMYEFRNNNLINNIQGIGNQELFISQHNNKKWDNESILTQFSMIFQSSQ